MRGVKRVSTHEAKTHLSRLLAQVLAGEEVVILRGDRAVARLVPYEASSPLERRRPRVGTVTSAPVSYDADAFEPLSDEELERDWGI